MFGRNWGRILVPESKSTARFRLPKEKELCHHGEYRIKLQIMEIYNRMRHAIDSRLSLKATYAATHPSAKSAKSGDITPISAWSDLHP